MGVDIYGIAFVDKKASLLYSVFRRKNVLMGVQKH